MFFRELDEGVWFYLRGRDLVAVPGSRPDYNDTYQTVEAMRARRFERDPEKRIGALTRALVSWLRSPDRASSYVVLRDAHYDLFAPALDGLAVPVYRERGLRRNALVLLRATAPAAEARETARRD